MANDKKKRVSKKARPTKKGEGQYDKDRRPGPEYVWHEGFDYRSKGGLVVRIRGHWERKPKLVKRAARPTPAKPKASAKSREGSSPELPDLARRNSKKVEEEAGRDA